MTRSQTYPSSASPSLTRGSPRRDCSGGAHNHERKLACASFTFYRLSGFSQKSNNVFSNEFFDASEMKRIFEGADNRGGDVSRPNGDALNRSADSIVDSPDALGRRSAFRGRSSDIIQSENIFHIAISSKRLSGVVKRRRLCTGGGAPIVNRNAQQSNEKGAA